MKERCNNIIVNNEFKNKIEKFIQNGGKIIAVYEGGLNEEKLSLIYHL